MIVLFCYSTDSDAFLTPEETSDDEETIENEELQMENEVDIVNFYTKMIFPVLCTVSFSFAVTKPILIQYYIRAAYRK